MENIEELKDKIKQLEATRDSLLEVIRLMFEREIKEAMKLPYTIVSNNENTSTTLY